MCAFLLMFTVFTFYGQIPTYRCVRTLAHRFLSYFNLRKAFFYDLSHSLALLDEIVIEIRTQSELAHIVNTKTHSPSMRYSLCLELHQYWDIVVTNRSSLEPGLWP